MRSSRYLADFDSATGTLRATADAVTRRGFPSLGRRRLLNPLAAAVDLLPERARQAVQSVRYNRHIRRIPDRCPVAEPLSRRQFDAFLAGRGDRYPVRWEPLASRPNG